VNGADKNRPPPTADDLEERMAASWQMLVGLGQASVATQEVPDEKKASIEFTLITGFLGAGKTTLLNALLAESHGARLAVIVNDFGSINIDAALVEKSSVNRVDLANGCVCCTLANGLTATLADLVSQSDPPDEIVLEASGIANPHGIVQVALCNAALHFNGIVCVVDSTSLLENVDNPPIHQTIESQISAANLILLNKTDIAKAGQLEAAKNWLAQRKLPGRVVETSHSRVPLSLVLGLPEVSQMPDFLEHGDHAASFESFAFASEALVDEKKLCELVETFPLGVLRAKGIMRLGSDPDRQAVLQVTGNKWSLQKGRQLSESRTSEMVVIGLSGVIDGDALRKGFEACRID